VAPGGKGSYPAMPYPAFVKISDDDMRAFYAYIVGPAKPPPPLWEKDMANFVTVEHSQKLK
jgi:hypothetical protein